MGESRMKYNLKNRPVKASPQAYERWIKGLERELRGKLVDVKDVKMVYLGSTLGRNALIREVLGE